VPGTIERNYLQHHTWRNPYGLVGLPLTSRSAKNRFGNLKQQSLKLKG